MTDVLEFEAIAKWTDGEAYAASAEYNALFKVDLKTGDCTYICLFDEEFDRKRLFTSAFKVKNKIFFVPSTAERIAVYEPDSNRLYGIDVKQPDGEKYRYYKSNDKFNGGYIYDGYLFMTPSTYPGIIRINADSNEVDYYTDWVSDGDHVFRKSPYVFGDVIYLPCTKRNNVLCFDMSTCKGQLVTLPTEHGSWWSMCNAADCFWIAPRNPGPIICWDKKTNRIEEYSQYPKGFEGKYFYFSLCFEREKKVYFLPARSNMGVYIDLTDKKAYEWKIDHVDKDSMAAYMFCLDNEIYLKISNQESTNYICINKETLSSRNYIFSFKYNKDCFKEDLTNTIRGTILQERKNLGLKWYTSLL